MQLASPRERPQHWRKGWRKGRASPLRPTDNWELEILGKGETHTVDNVKFLLGEKCGSRSSHEENENNDYHLDLHSRSLRSSSLGD